MYSSAMRTCTKRDHDRMLSLFVFYTAPPRMMLTASNRETDKKIDRWQDTKCGSCQFHRNYVDARLTLLGAQTKAITQGGGIFLKT